MNVLESAVELQRAIAWRQAKPRLWIASMILALLSGAVVTHLWHMRHMCPCFATALGGMQIGTMGARVRIAFHPDKGDPIVRDMVPDMAEWIADDLKEFADKARVNQANGAKP